MELGSLDEESLLSRAKKFIFSTGVNDIASRLCRANTAYGLAKLHLTQEEYGLEPSATFISTPDETITRNIDRWQNGVGYGGKISWGGGSEKFIFLDAKPNACGMLVGGLREAPSPELILKRLDALNSKELEIEGVPVEWDFNTGNHFIDIFKVSAIADKDLPEYAFIIHSSAPELKGETSKGMGLYYNQSNIIEGNMKIVETPFGESRILLGDAAKEYYEFYKFSKRFSEKRRLLAARELFEEFEVISNKTHQGLLNLNEVVLGCYHLDEDGCELYPITLRPDLPSYLVEGQKSFSEEILEHLGFSNRARSLGVLDRLLSFNGFPHGGGYTFPDMVSVRRVITIGGRRYFIVELQSELGLKVFSNPRELQFIYRGRQVVINSIELGLIKLQAKLIPEYVLKV